MGLTKSILHVFTDASMKAYGAVVMEESHHGYKQSSTFKEAHVTPT